MTAAARDTDVTETSPDNPPVGTPAGTEFVAPGVVREVRVMPDGRRITYYRRERE